jgi:hypothetical protein
MSVKKIEIRTGSQALEVLWIKKFFDGKEKKFQEIGLELRKIGCNPSNANLGMALKNAKYLTRRGPKGKYSYIQKYASTEIAFNDDVFSEKLINNLGSDFEMEINDLKLNYGRSGTCTAFLLRKILEKLIFLTFAKNNMSDRLRDNNNDYVGLKTMLNLTTVCKVGGKPFLMPKTAKAIEGIKFLGDTSAHNPLTNVDMKNILTQMPFIITAYEELTEKL